MNLFKNDCKRIDTLMMDSGQTIPSQYPGLILMLSIDVVEIVVAAAFE
jgi:hypothetical protein